MNELHIAPNRPLIVALVDPEGVFDQELNRGTYQTTTGETLILPRPAVVALNMIGPAPGEQIEILQSWSGLHGERPEWSVRLTNGSEKARAEAETAQDAPVEPPAPIKAPTPIRRAKDDQPRLFDLEKGTGTYGPMPAARAYAAPRPELRRRPPVEQIPANVAFREITRFVSEGLQANGMQWGDEA